MLEVVFEDWTEGTQPLHLMGMTHLLVSWGLNPSRSQGLSRLSSQSPVSTLEKTWEKWYAFRTSFPLAIPRRVTLQPFGLFHFCLAHQLAWRTPRTRQLSSLGHRLTFIMDSVQLNQCSQQLTDSTHVNDTGQGLFTHITALGHFQAWAVPWFPCGPEGYKDQWQNVGTCPGARVAFVHNLRGADLFHQHTRDVSKPSVILYG